MQIVLVGKSNKKFLVPILKTNILNIDATQCLKHKGTLNCQYNYQNGGFMNVCFLQKIKGTKTFDQCLNTIRFNRSRSPVLTNTLSTEYIFIHTVYLNMFYITLVEFNYNVVSKVISGGFVSKSKQYGIDFSVGVENIRGCGFDTKDLKPIIFPQYKQEWFDYLDSILDRVHIVVVPIKKTKEKNGCGCFR